MITLLDKKILDEIHNHLTVRGETIAVSESVTAGLLQASLGSAENARDFFHGGLTVYNIGQKARHLGVNAIHAAQCDCVSDLIAEQMAKQVTVLFASDWGIGITGYATPTPKSNGTLFCHYAIYFRTALLASKKMKATNTDPFKVQMEYVNAILRELKSCLKRHKNK